MAGLRKPSPAPRTEKPATPETTEESRPTEPTEPTGTTDTTEAPEAPESTETVEPADAPEAPEIPEAAESTESTETTDPAEQPAGAVAVRPSPRRKARDEGAAKPSSEDDVVGARAPGGPPPSTPASGRPRRNTYLRVAALVLATLVFAGLAVFFKIKHSEVAAATGNTALIDVATTAQVKQEMSTAAESLFSIDYNDLGKTEQAAKDLLANDEVRQKYESLMGEVKRLAPEQKIVVTVKATRSAVILLDDNRAKVMVYIDQTATRTDQNQSSAGGAAMWFTTEKRDGAWKVIDMDTYSSGQPTPTPAPESKQPEGN